MSGGDIHGLMSCGTWDGVMRYVLLDVSEGPVALTFWVEDEGGKCVQL